MYTFLKNDDLVIPVFLKGYMLFLMYYELQSRMMGSVYASGHVTLLLIYGALAEYSAGHVTFAKSMMRE